MITDADRLAAAGAELVIDGHTFHVRYTPRSLKLMEDKHGSLKAIGEMLQKLNDGDGPVFGPVFWILSLGLRHERVDGELIDEDWLLDHGDLKQIWSYAETAMNALVEALPAQPQGDTADPTPPQKGATKNGSTGEASSFLQSATSTEAQATSGTG